MAEEIGLGSFEAQMIQKLKITVHPFITKEYPNAISEVINLKQTGMVESYYEELEGFCNLLQLSEEDALRIFINNLNLKISKLVRFFCPNSLTHALKLAKQLEWVFDELPEKPSLPDQNITHTIQTINSVPPKQSILTKAVVPVKPPLIESTAFKLVEEIEAAVDETGATTQAAMDTKTTSWSNQETETKVVVMKDQIPIKETTNFSDGKLQTKVGGDHSNQEEQHSDQNHGHKDVKWSPNVLEMRLKFGENGYSDPYEFRLLLMESNIGVVGLRNLDQSLNEHEFIISYDKQVHVGSVDDGYTKETGNVEQVCEDTNMTVEAMEKCKASCSKEGKRKRSWEKEKYQLVEYHSLSEYLRDNEYIVGHYRSKWPMKHVLISTFTIHSETLNVWMHLIGFFIFFSLTIYTAMKVPKVVALHSLQHIPDVLRTTDLYKVHSKLMTSLPFLPNTPDLHKFQKELKTTLPSMELLPSLSVLHVMELLYNCLPECFSPGNHTDVCVLQSVKEDVANIIATLMVKPIKRWVFFAFLGGAKFCLLASNTCHFLSCHSERLSYIILRLDYAGIAVLISTSFYFPVYYSFMCDLFFCNLYMGVITVLGFATILFSLLPVFQNPEFRSIRASLFFGIGMFGISPILHKFILFWNQPEALHTTGYEVLMGLFYILEDKDFLEEGVLIQAYFN